MTAVFGEKLKIELFGTSHGPCVGVRMSGVPAGLSFDMQKLQAFLDRRAPGRNEWSTQRKEADVPRFLSGVEKKTYPSTPHPKQHPTITRTERIVPIKRKTLLPRQSEYHPSFVCSIASPFAAE